MAQRIELDTLAPVKRDTMRQFQIIRGPSLRMLETDTGSLQTIAGGAVVQHEGTRFSADSIVMNNTTRILQSFGNVHINDGDTVNIYSRYLSYDGNRKYAFLKNNVKLTGKNGTLYTEELDYNLNTSIGNYYKGGRIINEKNVITSQTGTYYADTRDVYFKKNVKMDGPKDHVRADSLIYNMNDGGITFVSDTYIKNNDVEIRTSEGRYDSNTGDAFFSSRTNIRDSSGRIYTSNTMALEGKTGNAQLEGNAIIIDSANGFSLLANQIFLDDKNNSFLATQKPLLIIQQKDDSTYLAADTIFSGLAYMLKKSTAVTGDSASLLNRQQTEKIINVRSDTLQNDELDSDSLHRKSGTLREGEKEDTLIVIPGRHSDSIRLISHDTLKVKEETTVLKDSVSSKKDTALKPPLHAVDSISTAIKQKDARDSLGRRDSIHLNNDTLQMRDSATITTADSSTVNPDSARFFIAYHHVRIYNDSMQSVCDSLFISSLDSVFRMYQNPVVWNGKTQVTGDTMYLFTKNKEAERLYVFDQALVISRTDEGFFNQMGGKTLNAFFKENRFDSIRFRGSQAEAVYYMQEEDSSYYGVSRTSGDVIEMLFKKGELNKVIFINKVPGKMYPMGEMPESEQKLKGFEWLDDRRPKNKAELFQ